MLNNIYKFIRQHFLEAKPLWSSAAQEIRTFVGLMPFLVSNWELQWSEHIAATDASEVGYGVCVRELPRGDVAGIGRTLERSRFKRVESTTARHAFFEANGFSIGDDGLWAEKAPANDLSAACVWQACRDFPEIILAILQKQYWRVALSQSWKLSNDDILVLEARALLKGLQVLVSVEK